LQEKEKILCIRQDRLPKAWMAKTAVVPMDFSAFVDHCTRAGHEFVNRIPAEEDTGWQQVIPYIILQTRDLGKTAVYLRQGSETRLHDLWSAGIGGHINPRDQTVLGESFQTILMSGMARELDEELTQRPPADLPVFCGIIHETVTDVGRVHLGAVFRILTQTPASYVPGPELFRFQWVDTNRLASMNMELWSCLAMDLLSRN
jgi:predicted NUDIX family phosphoesterase